MEANQSTTDPSVRYYMERKEPEPITYSVIVITTQKCLFTGSHQECWDFGSKQNFRSQDNITIRRN